MIKPSALVSRRKRHSCTELIGSRNGYLCTSVNQHRPTIALFAGWYHTNRQAWDIRHTQWYIAGNRQPSTVTEKDWVFWSTPIYCKLALSESL